MCHWQGIGGWDRIVPEPQVQPRDVVPAVELETDPSVDADGDESERFMEPHARGIRQRDPGVRVHEPLSAQQLEEGSVERASDTAPMSPLVHVDGDLHAPLVRLPGAVGRGVGVCDELVVALEHEPGISAAPGLQTVFDLGDSRHHRLERGRAIGHERRVDRPNRRRVGYFCESDSCSHGALESYIPARRAATIEPAVTLRSE